MGLARKRSDRVRLAWVHRWVDVRECVALKGVALQEWRTCTQTGRVINMARKRSDRVRHGCTGGWVCVSGAAGSGVAIVALVYADGVTP
jgi:hypothetical protein